MTNRFTLRNFLKSLSMRLGAIAVLVGIFFGLGHVKRINFLGMSGILGNRLAFLTTAFLLVALVAVSWILY